MAGNSFPGRSPYGNAPVLTGNTVPDAQRLRLMKQSLVYALEHCTGSERPLFLQIRRSLEMLDSRLGLLADPAPDPGAVLPWEVGSP